jgi:hypothetical protein
MKQPTQAQWNQLKEQRTQAAPSPQEPLTALPDGLFLPDDYQAAAASPEGGGKPASGRVYIRYDETWSAPIDAAGRSVTAATHRLIKVLLAKADYARCIKANIKIEIAANVTRHEKREALLQLEKLGLVTVEWRGRGLAPFVTPLHLGGRPKRK